MSSKTKAGSSLLRQEEIRRILTQKGSVSVSGLARLCEVSEMTIRRDLDKLEKRGQIKRTHGGAVPSDRMTFEYGFVARKQKNHRAKAAIAREAVKYIRPNTAIILDTGTTTLELAHLLTDLEDLTVITPSLAVASVLQFSPGVETILLGGTVRRGSLDLTGVITEKSLDLCAADMAFQGADGIGWDGTIYNGDLRIANVDRKIRERAAKMVVMADSSKIGKTALATNGSILDADVFISDAGMPSEHARRFREMGANVIIASEEDAGETAGGEDENSYEHEDHGEV